MRPNELAQNTIQEREHEWNKTLKKTGSNVLKLGASIAGAGIAARILPFLSEFITPDIALKGISKVSPKIGDFLNKGMTQGLSLTTGLKYLKQQLSGEGNYAGGEEEQEGENDEPQIQSQQQQQTKRAGPMFQGTHGAVPGSIRAQLQGNPTIQQQRALQAQGQPAQRQQKSQADAALLASMEKVLGM